jgi:hypothetical protein
MDVIGKNPSLNAIIVFLSREQKESGPRIEDTKRENVKKYFDSLVKILIKHGLIG